MVIAVSKLEPMEEGLDEWAEEFDDTVVHVERVVAYWSRMLKAAEKNYSPTEREALALKESLIKFQAYLEGGKFVAITDHAALTWSKTFQNVNQRLMTWGTAFAAYPDMEIVHRAGRVHSNVNPISRLRWRIPINDSPYHDDSAELRLKNSSELNTTLEENNLTFEERVLKLVEHLPAKPGATRKQTSALQEAVNEEIEFAESTLHTSVALHVTTLVAFEDSELQEFLGTYASDSTLKQILDDPSTEDDWNNPKKPLFYTDNQGLLFR